MSEPFDESAKGFLRQWFETRGIAVEVEFLVFSRERTLDLLVRCLPQDLEILRETVFAHFRRLNDMELKGEDDDLRLEGYNTILSRAWAVGGQRSGKPKGKPRPSGGVGPIDYPLLPLTTGAQREAFVEVCLREGLMDHLQLTLDIAKGDLAPAEILRRVMDLEKKMPLTREAFAVWDEYVRRRPHLREELIDVPQRKILHEILLSQLRHKFTVVPGEVIARIEATEDIAQLKAWLDRILDAPTIGDMGITPPTR